MILLDLVYIYLYIYLFIYLSIFVTFFSQDIKVQIPKLTSTLNDIVCFKVLPLQPIIAIVGTKIGSILKRVSK